MLIHFPLLLDGLFDLPPPDLLPVIDGHPPPFPCPLPFPFGIPPRSLVGFLLVHDCVFCIVVNQNLP